MFFILAEKIQKVIPSPPSNFEIIKSNENCNQDQETENNEKEKSKFFYDYK